MTSFVSRTVHGLLGLAGIPARRRRRDRAPVFCFHNVVEDGRAPVGDASLHMEVGCFARILDWITSLYSVVPLTTLSARAGAGGSLRGLAAVTFDDGCRGVYRHAAPLLRRAALPATVFVVPGAVASGRAYWWDRLAAEGRLDAAARRRCLEELRGDGGAVREAFPVDAGQGPLPDDLTPASWPTLLAGVRDGLSLESHTASHPNLTRIAPSEVARELEDSARTLRERTGRAPCHLAYPYGRVDDAVARAARAAGYERAWTLETRPVARDDDPHRMPRINVPAGIAESVLDCWANGIRLR